jgi:CspA family cold shock protein
VTELARGAVRRGVVIAFDEQSGLGEIDGSDGTDYGFHCIEIADGSRTIVVGADVSFDLLAKLGRWEAANIRS